MTSGIYDVTGREMRLLPVDKSAEENKSYSDERTKYIFDVDVFFVRDGVSI